jgi:uncharacterized protein with ParB-like and HNH nuclease domain
LQANPRTITALFEPNQRYVVPMFQRHYVWTQSEQWEPLWHDIEEKLEARRTGRRVTPHFLGAVILDSARRTSTKQVSRFIVIDGQQRLTTFQLLIAALRDSAKSRNLPHIARAAERCILNPDIELMERPDEEQFKLWPTQMNRKAFCQVVTAGSYEKVRECFPIVKLHRKRKPEPRERLAEAYEYFYENIHKTCTECDCDEDVNELLLSFLGVLRDEFTVVEIILGDNDNSQEIFNSLNARGKPLSQSDLLRSYIFMRAEQAEVDRDRLYENYWARFESPWWDEISRRGNISSSRLDTLTRTLLAAKLGSPVDVRRVHSAYTDWIESKSPYESLEDELRDFVRYGLHYEQLQGKSVGSLSEFGRRMSIWDTSTVFPLAIFLAVEGCMSKEDLLNCLSQLESFIVRRAICGLQTKEYNKFFIEVVSRLRKVGVSGLTLKKILNAGEGETRRFPDDLEFATAWKTKQIYNRLSSSQITLMLQQLEHLTRSDRAEMTPIPYVSVEHIMPQQWTDNYPLLGEIIPAAMNADWYFARTEEERSQHERLQPHIQLRRSLIHSIGNLTAVTQPLNAAMKNAGFKEKKSYFGESVLALNRYFEPVMNWDEAAIKVRADKLFTSAVAVWYSP